MNDEEVKEPVGELVRADQDIDGRRAESVDGFQPNASMKSKNSSIERARA